MDTPPLWVTILQGMMKSSSERQHLSTVLGVTTMTLSRWVNGESKPQKNHIVHLIQVVPPSQRQDFIESLEEQYPDVQSWLNEDVPEQISSEFFSQVLNLRTTTAESLRFWRISELVLRQALAQLDPKQLGMAVKLIQCMPPSEGGKVRSLRERAGKGNPPWSADLEHDVLFLGLESMSGYTTEVRHIVQDDDLSIHKTFPALQDQYEVSAAAHPIRFEGRIAGCLLASSTKQNHFTPARQNLLIAFSDLIALAFDKKDFYPPSMIELRVMPKPQVQRPILANFRQRVTTRFQESMARGDNLSNADIELLTWQELEAELLSIPDDSPSNPSLRIM